VAGVELLHDLYEISVSRIDELKMMLNSTDERKYLYTDHMKCDVSALEGDFLDDAHVAEWTDADIVLANSTCFEDELMQKLAANAVRMRAGARFITFTRPLTSTEFEIVDTVNLGMSWGLATCYIHVRKPE
jgi:hypothetical protein